jgi:hypothetical protein
MQQNCCTLDRRYDESTSVVIHRSSKNNANNIVANGQLSIPTSSNPGIAISRSKSELIKAYKRVSKQQSVISNAAVSVF